MWASISPGAAVTELAVLTAKPTDFIIDDCSEWPVADAIAFAVQIDHPVTRMRRLRCDCSRKFGRDWQELHHSYP